MDTAGCSWNADTFSATAIYTGESRLVRVTGSGECPGGGYDVAFEYDDPGIVPEPANLYLRIVETPGGGVGTDALTPMDVEDEFDVGQEVNRVIFRALALSLDVQEPA